MIKKILLFGLLMITNIFFASSLIAQSINAHQNTLASKAEGLDKRVLALGMSAYQYANEHHLVKNNILTIVDYSKPSDERRMWVIDMKRNEILFHNLVTHGKYNGTRYASRFSNEHNTLSSNIGVFLTANSYVGQHGYSLRLHGMEKGINHNAYTRNIVMHKAWYANPSFAEENGRLGRSWGCFALPEDLNSSVIDNIKGGSLLFAYYPDEDWLTSSRFLQKAA